MEEALTSRAKGQLFTYNGKTLMLAEWANEPECKVSLDTLIRNVDSGQSFSEALLPNVEVQSYKLNGKQLSLYKWKDEPECKVSYGTLQKNIKKGMPIAEALVTKPHTPSVFRYNGKCLTATAWSRQPECQVSRKTLKSRLDAGIPIDEALQTASKTYTFRGTIYKTIDELSALPECRVSRSTVTNRLRDGWSVERAVTTGGQEPMKLEAYGRELTLSEWLDAPEASGSLESSSAISWRLQQGWTPEDAISTKSSRELEVYSAFGKQLPLVSWAAEPKCVVTLSTLRRRIAMGMGIESALTTPPLRVSQLEMEMSEFLNSYGVEYTTGDRTVIGPKELDFFVPLCQVGLELNGLYWHSEAKRPSQDYHFAKWKACNRAGVRLLQIWEDDWLHRRSIVERLVLNSLGLSTAVKINARECSILTLSYAEASEFLQDNHIQGKASGSEYVGLHSHEYGLVAVAVFRNRKESAELVRFASSHKVRGGFSKLVAWYRKSNNRPLYTFADLCLSNGDLYKATGWELDKVIPPDYKYLGPGNIRVHKFNYRKARFRDDDSLLWNPNLSETELAELNNLHRVWDAGKLRFVLK